MSCPSCFSLLFDGAVFCHHCGAARSRAEPAEGQPIRCPACPGEMQWVRLGATDLLECDSCDGTWIEATAFKQLCTDRESQAAVLHAARQTDTTQASAEAVRYRPCPRCSKLMNRVNFGRFSGAIVDVCRDHGTFLDRGELHQVIRFIQEGGLERTRAAQREELAEQERRLRELERAATNIAPAAGRSAWNETSLHKLLTSLFGGG